jgi:hypothetical protein
MHVFFAIAMTLGALQERPLPVPSPRFDVAAPAPLADPSGWFVASDPYGPSAILHIEAVAEGWRAHVITLPTTGRLGHTWCDIVAVAPGAAPSSDGLRFVSQGASVDAGPRWSPQPANAEITFGVAVYAREAVITDMGAGQALCGPGSELTGLYSRMPD